MCFSAALPLMHRLPPASSFFSIDALTVKCSLCLHCWPHQLGQSLMTHYTHINRAEHKQSSRRCSVTAQQSVSLLPPYHCLKTFFTLHLPFTVFIFLSACLCNMHTVCMHAEGTGRRGIFLEMEWKLAPIKETNKVTSVLYACQVVEGIQLENIWLRPWRLSSWLHHSVCWPPICLHRNI